MKKNSVYLLFLLLTSFNINAQTFVIPSVVREIDLQQSERSANQDTVTQVVFNENELDKIVDIRAQFEKQNRSYTRPLPPSEGLLRFLKKDKLEMSEEAMYWINMVKDASTLFDANMTFRDTMIVNPLFLPPMIKGEVLPQKDKFYDLDPVITSKTPFDNPVQEEAVFADIYKRQEIRDSAYAYIRNNHPTYFRYSERDLPNEIIKPSEIKVDIKENLPITVETEAKGFEDLDAPAKFIPERQYWQSKFESAIQFSQSYVSPNWHKGGSSNLNLFTKNYLGYDYKKDKVQFTNEIEVKISAYTAPKDTLRDYKIGDDILRIHSNLGYQAFNKWFYTFDVEFKTQLFQNFKENTNNVKAAMLAPFSINLGLGMKYDLTKQFDDKHKNIKLNLNLAPISYTFMHSIKDNIDFGRHGFEKKKGSDEYNKTLGKFGSTIRTEMIVNFNRNVSWQSKFYYSTSYDRVLCEFENTLTLAINRYFSTRIYAHVRFDDSATKNEDFDSYFQINELLSFGFNYKW